MATPPVFSVGQYNTAAYMNAIGLWLISAGSSSGATGYNYDNVFTSDFRNYRILISGLEVATGGSAVRLNFRSSGSTNTAGNYNYAYRGIRETGATADTALANATFVEIGIYCTLSDLNLGFASIDVYAPQVAERTFATANAVGYEGANQYRQGGFGFNGNDQFDGFRISLSGSGNVSYNYAIYGYRD